jgi:serine/threonine protein kinase
MIHRRTIEGSADVGDEEGPLQIGTRFLDKYEIRGRLGHGGQAWIYLGQHIFTAREVAIKIIYSPQGVTREMLVRGKSEARALGKLDHPNIVVMHDAGVTDEGLFYIVMELLRGHSLRATLAARGRLGVEEMLRLAIQAGEAVQAAHELHMIHRDLKPDNIFLTKDNRLKVLDFGIAKMLNEIGFTTRKDIVIGSLLYMSPEQVQGLPISAQSDICALGLMTFEALIGKHPSLLVFERDLIERKEPYRTATLADIPVIQAGRMPPMLSDLDPEIPHYVAQVVHRSIEKVARHRFSSMRELVSALRVCLESVCRELPTRGTVANERDLSQRVLEASEVPSSQRATPKLGIHWERAGSPAPSTPKPVPAQAASVALETRIDQATPLPPRAMSWSLKPATPRPVAIGSRDTDRRTSLANATLPVRNAIVGGCLFGGALGTVSALMYFGTASPASSRAQPTLSALAVSTASWQSPALAVAESARVVPLPAPPSPAPVGTMPTAHARPTPARATASAKSVAKTTDGVAQLESDLGGDRSKNSQPSTSSARAKLINGGRLIYGD